MYSGIPPEIEHISWFTLLSQNITKLAYSMVQISNALYEPIIAM